MVGLPTGGGRSHTPSLLPPRVLSLKLNEINQSNLVQVSVPVLERSLLLCVHFTREPVPPPPALPLYVSTQVTHNGAPAK